MKRLAKILLSIFLIVPSVLGMCFISPKLAPETALMTSNGGGGGKPLDSPKIGENSDFEGDNQEKENDNDVSLTWIEPIYKTYEDYFTDYNITAETITEQDLTGSGSAIDPYFVRSTRGFLWLTNSVKSGIALYGKHIELACDIILNDETFDENGTPSGGDGVVYEWQPYSGNSNFYIYGNNYSIKGMYINQPEKSVIGLIGGVIVSLCENLIMEDFFVCGKNVVYTIAMGIAKARNLISTNGTLRGYQMGGFAFGVTEAYNCNNYANLYATSYDMGGLFEHATYLENCNNYGTISGKQNMGGIVKSGGTIVNCNNYGEIISTLSSAGGISGSSVSQLIGCNNYGKITHYSSCGGGLVGQQSQDVYIYNCANYGEIKVENTRGSFIGYVSKACKITIISSKSVSSCHLIGYLYVEDCYLNIRDLNIEGNGKIVNVYEKNTTIDVENIYINYTNTANGKKLFENKKSGCSIILKNIIVNFYEDNLSNTNFICANANDFDGIVFQNLGRGREKYFYGEDFEEFYFSWKSGKIGLKVFDGKGFYQSAVDKEWLIDRGFQKLKI